MKKIVLLIVFAAFLCQGISLFAQQKTSNFEESEYYYFNFTIEKVYTHRLGFMIIYQGHSNKVSRTFVPHEWFNTTNGPGEIVYLGTGKEWPSMIVYYKNGEFSHVRLRLRQNKLHETWGVIPFDVAADDFFKGIEEVKLNF